MYTMGVNLKQREETMKKVTYIRCPRCELNYITKEEKFCSVCKQEMQVGGGNSFDELDLELCPICKTNYIQPDEIMCSSCLQERSSDPNFEESDEWDKYVNRDEDEESSDTQDEEIGEMSSVKMLGIDDDDLDSGLDDDDDLDALAIDDEDDKDDLKDDDDYDDFEDDYDDYEDEDEDDDD